MGRAPKGNDRIPTIHFQVRTVSFREGNSLSWSIFVAYSLSLSAAHCVPLTSFCPKSTSCNYIVLLPKCTSLTLYRAWLVAVSQRRPLKCTCWIMNHFSFQPHHLSEITPPRKPFNGHPADSSSQSRGTDRTRSDRPRCCVAKRGRIGPPGGGPWALGRHIICTSWYGSLSRHLQGFYTSQLVQDFVHQPYVYSAGGLCWDTIDLKIVVFSCLKAVCIQWSTWAKLVEWNSKLKRGLAMTWNPKKLYTPQTLTYWIPKLCLLRSWFFFSVWLSYPVFLHIIKDNAEKGRELGSGFVLIFHDSKETNSHPAAQQRQTCPAPPEMNGTRPVHTYSKIVDKNTSDHGKNESNSNHNIPSKMQSCVGFTSVAPTVGNRNHRFTKSWKKRSICQISTQTCTKHACYKYHQAIIIAETRETVPYLSGPVFCSVRHQKKENRAASPPWWFPTFLCIFCGAKCEEHVTYAKS